MRQFRDWHFTKGAVDAPQEYIDFILCTQVYHCTPTELDEQPALLTGLHLDFWTEDQQRQSGKKQVRRGATKPTSKPGAPIMERLTDDARRIIQRVMTGKPIEDD